MNEKERAKILGALLRARRVQAGYRTREAYLEHLRNAAAFKFAPSPRTMGALERGEDRTYSPDTVTAVDAWYVLPPGTARAILDGEHDGDAQSLPTFADINRSAHPDVGPVADDDGAPEARPPGPRGQRDEITMAERTELQDSLDDGFSALGAKLDRLIDLLTPKG